MCNAKLLIIFISMCSSYIHNSGTNFPSNTPMLKCVKALDVCVDRQIWDMTSVHRANMSEKEMEDEAISICDYDINALFEFGSYSSDNRCKWDSIKDFRSLLKSFLQQQDQTQEW